jgi:hypothetical protein
MAEPGKTLGGPRRTGRVVPPARPVDDPAEQARIGRAVDATEDALNQRRREGWNRKRGPTQPAVADHGGLNGHTDAYHPPVRGHLVAMEKLLRKVEQKTYQRMSTVFDDWVDLTNILLDQLPAHMREAVQTGRISDWPDGTPPERIDAFERIKARYGEKAPEVFTYFSHAAAELLDATHDFWFDWLGQLYMSLELGGRGVGDYYTPWPVAYLMAEMEDIPTLLNARLKEALMHEDNAMGFAVGITGMLFQPGPAGQAPIMGDDQVDDFFTRYALPAAAPYFDPITICDPACGSGVMLLASAATVPLWARRYGFVQFYGQDVMRIAVQMAKVQTRAYGLNGYEAAIIESIGEAGWDKFRAQRIAMAERAEAAAAELLAHPEPEAPPLTVIPRAVTGHVAHPTLRRRAAEQAAPTFNLVHPTAEQAARLLAGRPRPQRGARGARP